MKTKESHLTTLEEFKETNYGARGGQEREALERGYKDFRAGALIHDARVSQGLTQEQLAAKVGTSKSYISQIENNVKEVRLSTLQRIVEKGLGGKLELVIRI
jgi:ribosome-binding protein aMBF1 (putative translation factor)